MALFFKFGTVSGIADAAAHNYIHIFGHTPSLVVPLHGPIHTSYSRVIGEKKTS